MEINPEHPVTKAANENWHKIAALILSKLNIEKVSITVADIEKADMERKMIVLHDTGGVLNVMLLDTDKALQFAREHGAAID